jgi:casein kinase 1/casein kinase 1 delta
LKFEYEILRDLQRKFFLNTELTNIPRVYEFVESSSFNFIAMELLGKNISNLKKSMGGNFTDIFAYDILLQMLNCIENVHSKGYIHRDIKPTNFVICSQQKKVFIVDFGLAKLHLNQFGETFPERKNADFRGTIAFASMNAHNRIVSIILTIRISVAEMIFGLFFS